MLPPVDDAVLQQNPDFAALYKTLTTAVLNEDGSSKMGHGHKEREAVKKDLKAYRLKAARQHLLTEAISSAVPQDLKPPTTTAAAAPAPARRLGGPVGPPPLSSTSPSAEPPSPELIDLLTLLPHLLSAADAGLSPESTSLLLSSPPFSNLPSLLPSLAALLTAHLRSSALALARLANPSTNPSYLHRSIPSLPAQASALRHRVPLARASLLAARLAAASRASALLDAQTACLAALLRALEAKHGTVARSLELRAEDVALSAERARVAAEQALWRARRDVYTPEARAALRGYADHLRDGRVRLEEAMRSAEMELAEYGVGEEGDGAKERTMREMARVYREMGRQLREVKGDLERLGKA